MCMQVNFIMIHVIPVFGVLQAPDGRGKGGGGRVHERGGDTLRLAKGWKFRIFVSLRVKTPLYSAVMPCRGCMRMSQYDELKIYDDAFKNY